MTHRNYKEEADISPQTQMEEKEYNVDFFMTIVAMLALPVIFFLPFFVRNHWVISVIAFILGLASFLTLMIIPGRALIKKRPITRRLIYIFIVSVFAQMVSVGLFTDVIIDVLMRGYNPI